VPVTANLPDTNFDYSSASTTFNVGSTSNAMADILITAVDDRLVEGQETFLAQPLSSLSDATLSPGVSGSRNITVNDNDTATVTLSGTATIAESNTPVGQPLTA